MQPLNGISSTLRDYGLFHQWIAQGKAPKSLYASVEDLDKDLLSKSESGKGTGSRNVCFELFCHLPDLSNSRL